MADIKALLDGIIKDTDSSYPVNQNSDSMNGNTFDQGAYKDKLSGTVMKDIVSAMMNDETREVNDIIDQRIANHINQNYNGSCYGYLCQASKSLGNSPIVDSIIQEINAKTDACAQRISESKDGSIVDEEVPVSELIKNVGNYDELRERIKDTVTKKVVADVSNVITKSNDAPVFDKVDEKLDDITNESMIMKMTAGIVTEYATEHHARLATEEGMNIAVAEYCIAEMDRLFKQRPKVSIYAKYC